MCVNIKQYEDYIRRPKILKCLILCWERISFQRQCTTKKFSWLRLENKDALLVTLLCLICGVSAFFDWKKAELLCIHYFVLFKSTVFVR